MSGDLPEWMRQEQAERRQPNAEDPSAAINNGETLPEPAEQRDDELDTGQINLDAFTGGSSQSQRHPGDSLHQIELAPLTNLKASQLQLNHAALLEQLIRDESRSDPIRPHREDASQPFLRILFAVLILSFIVLAYFFSERLLPFINLDQEADALKIIQLISSVQPGAPVLVAVDYSPGLSGEMTAIAAPVITHLIQQGVYLTFVSTLPDGIAQSENLVARSKKGVNTTYEPISHYAILGFIPAGSTGIRAFSNAPQSVLPQAINAPNIWSSLPLEQIQNIEDFSMVLVIADQTDTARGWIEQIGTQLSGRPFILILSAQAAPSIQPYLDTRPAVIGGFLAGLPGGMAYRSMLGQTAGQGRSLAMLGVGLWIGMILILAGSIFSVAARSWAERHPSSPMGRRL